MGERRAPAQDVDKARAIAAYKQILRDVLDRRPSGTRHRLSQALGKARSFISQITNPTYAISIPAPHLAVIFEVCHLSPAEQKRFLAAYAQAHPRRPVALENRSRLRTMHLLVPDLGSEAQNTELDRLIHDFVNGLTRVAQASGTRGPTSGRTS